MFPEQEPQLEIQPFEIESRQIDSANFLVDGSICSTGWNTALARKIRFETQQKSNIQSIKYQTRRARLNQVKIKTKSFFFNVEETEFQKQQAEERQRKAKQNKSGFKKRDKSIATRIEPPKDIIKLQDRLFFMLQPPLESVLSESLSLRFQPFPYQYDGIAFLYPRHAAVLADEMGLGKTMQAITTIRMLLHRGEVQNVLLICPKPLVSNWAREFETWAPEVPISIIEGSQAKRIYQWKMDAPVKIANYELVNRDGDIVTSDDLHFDLVALDEAQRIKNRDNSTSKLIQKINRTRNWALTGTPVENSHEDLLGIFEFLMKGFLHPSMRPRQMANEISDYILRRTKEKVLDDLPPKMIRDANIILSDRQQESYERAETDGVVKLGDLGEKITIQHVFELVLRLKQICNFDPVTGDSSKLERLSADLNEIVRSGQKALVFSQWVKTLKKIGAKIPNFEPLEFHGRIPSKKRDGILDQFKNDPKRNVLLISYGAGSVGLNLQFCRYVFLFDRWWNPAIEDQAINRAHRIGSAGSVTVTRFTSAGTIEERIHSILEEKRDLFNSLISTDGETGRWLTQKDIFGLFDLKPTKSKITKAA